MFDAADRARKLAAQGNRRKRRPLRVVRDGLRALAARWRGATAIALTAVTAGGLAFWASRTPCLSVREVLVNRTARLTAAEVLDLVHVRAGQNLLALDLDDVRRRIEEHPWVARAYVRRVLPGRLVVRIEEREPVAIVHLDDLYYLDGLGRVFKKVLPGRDPMDYPVITGLTRRDVLEGVEADRLLARALELIWQGRRGESTFGGLSEVKIDTAGDFTLVTEREGLVVRLGADRFPAKLERLAKVLAILGARSGQVARIDLGRDGRAVVQWMKTAAIGPAGASPGGEGAAKGEG
jgi:cell division protein FtsQ